MNFTTRGKKNLLLLILTFTLVLTSCSDKKADNNHDNVTKNNYTEPINNSEPDEPEHEENSEFANVAKACFRALDAEVAKEPAPYFPYIALQASDVEGLANEVKAPYEYTLYRYWTKERLDKDFDKLAAFRTNPIWLSDTADLAAIVPVFSDESRRLFYKESGLIDNRVELTIWDEDSYYSTRDSFLARLKSEPDGGGGGPAPSDTIVNACKPLVELVDSDPTKLYLTPIESEDEADMEWSENIYPFRNLISLFSGYKDEYLYLHDAYVLSYHTNHSKLMNLAAHVYSKEARVTRVWMEVNGEEIELRRSENPDANSMNTGEWTLYDADVTSDLFSQSEELAQVYVELDNGSIKKLNNM
ncbi:hypothetical protein [Paenibacillus segetis]|uniref:Lipoprotein n=1 Tax=Paenibacillus segetis TaxID=1325360 RepID=A0ABQ1Y390_9BACL|nr:hypothetical protein [Paenibacillus segetis]GGH11072.1 hypothetical protein GCM10008013_02750 [Paenibacillus segetis]